MHTPVSLHFINPLLKILSAENVCIDQIAQQAGVDLKQFDSQPEFFPLLDLCKLWQAAIQYLDDPLLAIKAGQAVHPSDYGLIGALAMNCANIGEALLSMSHYRHLFNGGFHSRTHAGINAIYEFIAPPELSIELARPIIELDFSANISMAKFITNHQYDELMTPNCIGFNFPALVETKKYEELLGCSVLFNQDTNCLMAELESLGIKVHAPNAALKESIIQQIEILKANASRQKSFAYQIESYIRALLPTPPSIDQAAAEFYTSKRTLKRRLHTEGKNYKLICDQLRKDYAIEAIRRGYTPIAEVAFDMGFSSTSAFHRAFKRWTGLSPKAFIEQRHDSSDREEKSEQAA